MNSKKAIGAGALALMLFASVASAQTTYTPTDATTNTSSTTTTDPNVPNTGAGGSATENALLLATSGAVALGGLYLLRRRNV